MNYTILALTALAIAIVAAKIVWNEIQKSWPEIYVKNEDRLKDEACNITSDVPRAEYRVKDKINKIQDKELGKLLMLGKSYTARIAEGRDR